ncbi:MAG TPA: ABC transporter substrate-binding protein [Acidimicrobiia bacterium]|nr:ABC transporter substrate-binding protein [Acidimicrobiia bacterium]
MRHPVPRTGLAAGLLALALLGAACGSGSSAGTAKTAGGRVAAPVVLRLGYFPNLTHATAIAGVEKGFFADKLGPGVQLKTSLFNAGPAAVEALFSDALDATYIGPNPAINAFVKSNGAAVRIVAGATSGGALLVVKPTVAGAADLKGRTIASPQLGNTQDVALRTWLAAQGLKTETSGGGDVHVGPQDNAQALEAFKSGAIAGAWEPEPWATRMVQEGGGKVLVDERSLWPGGQFVTTQLLVRTAYLQAHPDVIERLVEGHVAATDYLNAKPAEARGVVNAGIAKLTGKALPDAVVTAAWNNLTFTVDPVAASLRQGAANAQTAGLLDKSVKLDGIYDLTILDRVLGRLHRPAVKV